MNHATLVPWKPGQSGNPKGRPKELSPIRDLARAYSVEMLEILVSIARDPRGLHRVPAACAVLDRAWGKPKDMPEDANEAFIAVPSAALREVIEQRGSGVH